MAQAWDKASAHYLALRGGYGGAVSYGALAPDESELGLLGELRGARVLDVGCGGGHNAVACAQAGAHVTALDLSARQLEAARRLTAQHAPSIRFIQGDIGQETVGFEHEYGLVLATQVLAYVGDLANALANCRKALGDAGRMVASVDHPLRACFMDAETDEPAGVPLRSYFDETPLTWRFDAGTVMQARHLSLGGWLGAFEDAGLRVRRVLEPSVPTELADELWPLDSALAPLRLIPHTVIFVLTPD